MVWVQMLSRYPILILKLTGLKDCLSNSHIHQAYLNFWPRATLHSRSGIVLYCWHLIQHNLIFFIELMFLQTFSRWLDKYKHHGRARSSGLLTACVCSHFPEKIAPYLIASSPWPPPSPAAATRRRLPPPPPASAASRMTISLCSRLD